MRAPVRMDNRMLTGSQCPYRVIQHGIDQVRIRAGADIPGHHQPIEAIDDRRDVDLPCRNVYFRQIGQPFRIRRRRVKVAIQQIRDRWCRVASIRREAPAARCSHDQTLLRHQATHDLLGHTHATKAQGTINASIAIAAVVVLEDSPNDLTHLRVLVGPRLPQALIEVCAARQLQAAQQIG